MFSDTSEWDSTSSSDEALEIVLLQRIKRQKNEDYIEHVVPQYSENVFLEHFRVRRQVTENIAEQYEKSSFYNGQSGGYGKLLPYQQILIFLWFAGHEAAGFRDVADKFNISISTLCYVIKKVTRFVSSLAIDVIKWPSPQEKVGIEAHFRGNGLPGVVGVVDGSHIRIDRPSHDPDSYLNMKQYFSIQMQVVCDHQRRVRDVFVGNPGSVDDGRAFIASPLFNSLEEKCVDLYILGDSAYPCLRHLLTPYRNTGNLTRRQINFNLLHSRNRCVIEHCFGQLKQRFRHLYHIKLKKIEDIVHFIRACCVLHNLSIDDKLFEDGEGCDNEGAEHDCSDSLADAQGAYDGDETSGIDKRNCIAAALPL